MASVMAAFGTFASRPLADPPVNLQASTPGVAQNGHVNVNGQVIVRNLYASTSVSDAVTGLANATLGTGAGGLFFSAANNGKGVSGVATSATGFNYGGYFESGSNNGKAVFGTATNSSGTTYGVHGRSASIAGRGVFGEATAATGTTFGVYGRSTSVNGRGVFGESTSATGTNYAGFFQSASPTGYGVLAKNSGGGVGLRAESAGTALQVVGSSTFIGAIGFMGPSSFSGSADLSGPTQLFGTTTVSGPSIFQQPAAFQSNPPFSVSSSSVVTNLNADKLDGKDSTDFLQSIPVPLVLTGNELNGIVQVNNSSFAGPAISGISGGSNGHGVFGQGLVGVRGFGLTGVEGKAFAEQGIGVYGYSQRTTTTTYGVQGEVSANNPAAFGVYSFGSMGASGTKPFRIDHPFDPANKYLFHYSSESPLPQNFYNGNVRTDADGQAWVTLPDYFEEINKDFKYTLTVVDDTDSPDFVQVKVAKKIKNNRFKIRTSVPNVEVSWRVDALRNDKWVQKNPPKTEVDKEGSEKGTYQHPELYGMPAEMGTNYARTHREAQTTSPPR